jgi:DMSO reductase family type II enzyme chaperone
MPSTSPTVERGEVALARATLCRLYAQAFREPGSSWKSEWDEIAAGVPTALDVLASDDSARAAAEREDLGPLWAGANDLERLRGAHTRLIGHCPRAGATPYETEWTGSAGEILQYHLLADLCGFYEAFGLALAPECDERADHLALELCFLGFLCVKEAHAEEQSAELDLVRAAQCSFLEQHLLAWAPAFCARVEREDEAGFHGRAARHLASFLERERERFGLAAPSGLRELSESQLALEDCCVGCDLARDCAGPEAHAEEPG